MVELIGGEEGVAIARQGGTACEQACGDRQQGAAGQAWRGLAELAEKNLALKFEAAVAGGIPIVKTLRESLIAHGVDAVKGILNGTCNYILTQMEAAGRGFPRC